MAGKFEKDKFGDWNVVRIQLQYSWALLLGSNIRIREEVTESKYGWYIINI